MDLLRELLFYLGIMLVNLLAYAAIWGLLIYVGEHAGR